MLIWILPILVTMPLMIVPTPIIVVPAASVLVLVVVPMPLTFPPTPVLSHIIMRNPVILRAHAAVSVRNVDHRTRYVSNSH